MKSKKVKATELNAALQARYTARAKQQMNVLKQTSKVCLTSKLKKRKKNS